MRSKERNRMKDEKMKKRERGIEKNNRSIAYKISI